MIAVGVFVVQICALRIFFEDLRIDFKEQNIGAQFRARIVENKLSKFLLL